MKQNQRTPAEIAESLNRAERLRQTGRPITLVCRELGISRPTYYRWKREFGGMTPGRAEAWAVLQQEKQRLHQALSEQEQQVEILRSIVEGNSSALLANEKPSVGSASTWQSANVKRAGRSISIVPRSVTAGRYPSKKVGWPRGWKNCRGNIRGLATGESVPCCGVRGGR